MVPMQRNACHCMCPLVQLVGEGAEEGCNQNASLLLYHLRKFLYYWTALGSACGCLTLSNFLGQLMEWIAHLLIDTQENPLAHTHVAMRTVFWWLLVACKPPCPVSARVD